MRALAWAALGAGLLCSASLLVLGASSWRAFLQNSSLARVALDAGLVGYAKMASAFAAARLLRSDLPPAWIIQALSSVTALAVVIGVSRRRPGAAAEMATLAAA